MHEFPITQQIIKLAEKHATELCASRIKSIKLVVGRLLRLCWGFYSDVF